MRINDALTFDFDTREDFEPLHYAFKVSEAAFDAIFARIRGEGIPYGSGPRALEAHERAAVERAAANVGLVPGPA